MFNKSQSQHSGDKSTNLQAARDINNYGLQYSDVREIFHDLFKANFPILRAEAATIAEDRAEFITERFWNNLLDRNPDTMHKLNQPDLQYNLLTIQREYAKSGNTEIGNLLVELLIERTVKSERSVLQATLDEAFEVVPKLSTNHLNIITLALLSRNEFLSNCNQYSDLITFFEKKVRPFATDFVFDQVDFAHLTYLRCVYQRHNDNGGNNVLNNKLASNTHLRGYFSNGATQQQIKDRFGEINGFDKLLTVSFHDPTKLRLKTYDNVEFKRATTQYGIPNEIADELFFYFNAGSQKMNETQINQLVCKDSPCMQHLFEINERLSDFELFPLGIVIAQANYKSITKETLDISQWVR